MNAGARVMFAMGRHGFFPASTTKSHPAHRTPHVALMVMAGLMFVIVTVFKAKWASMEVLDEFNNAGTMGAFGFLGAYFLVTLAAPRFLKKRSQLKTKDVIFCVAAVAMMIIPAVGSVYPVPPAPVNYFPYIFLGYLVIGLLRTLMLAFTQMPDHKRAITDDMEKTYAAATVP
jgi:amino acid transporter